MKHLLIAFLTIFSLNTFASQNTFKAEVDSFFCGEIDPFFVGDACLMYLTKEGTNSKLALLMDESYGTLEEDDLIGMEVIIDETMISKIDDGDVIYVLKDMDSDYFYMEAMDGAITLTSSKEMKQLVPSNNTYFRLPQGYSKKEITNFNVNKIFERALDKARTEMKMVQDEIRAHAKESERSHYDIEEILSYTPENMLEIYEVYEIYKGDILIGYRVEVNNHVQAAIYQDGAWYVFYLDVNQNVVLRTEESA